MSDSNCGDSGGTCRTKNKVWWEADENFPKDPKFGQYPTWSRLQFHKKLLVLMLKILHMQTDMETEVPINGQFMGQITWLKKFLSSSGLEAGDAADQAHVLGKQAVSSLDGKLYSDQKALTSDVLSLESELNGIDAGQDTKLNTIQSDGPFRAKIVGMSDSSYVRSMELWKKVNTTDVEWNTTLRPDGQTKELSGMVGRAMGETSQNIGDGIYRYTTSATSRYQTGYHHLRQLYENFKYLTEMHLRKADRHTGKIEENIPEREMNVMDLVQFVKQDGHLETGTIVSATSNVTAIVQAMLSEVEDLVTNSVMSLADAKAWIKAQEEAAKAAAAAAAAVDAASEANKTSVLPVDVIAFTPAKFLCSGTETSVATCDKCTSGICASPEAAVFNLDTENGEMWNPIAHSENADDISVTLDAKTVEKVSAILWANKGDTDHDPTTLKIETANTPEGPWTEVKTFDMSSLRGDSKKSALKLEPAVDARYFKLSPGGIQDQSIPRVVALCSTDDCKKEPAPPTDSVKIDNLAKAVAAIAEFLKGVFPNGAPAPGKAQGSVVTWEKIFDGECVGPELYMYTGAEDNPGTNDAERTSLCGEACLAKKPGRTDHPAVDGNWDDGFVATGFVVIPATGRCFCESPESATCTRVSNDYRRYDFITSAAADGGNTSPDGATAAPDASSPPPSLDPPPLPPPAASTASSSGSELGSSSATPAKAASAASGSGLGSRSGSGSAKSASPSKPVVSSAVDSQSGSGAGSGSGTPASGPKASLLLLNMYCNSYEDAAGRGDTGKMEKYIAKCRPQDCEQAKEDVGCHYMNANGFCWIDSGQRWCAENKASPWCLTSVADRKYEVCEGQGETKEWEVSQAIVAAAQDTAADTVRKPSSLSSRGRGRGGADTTSKRNSAQSPKVLHTTHWGEKLSAQRAAVETPKTLQVGIADLLKRARNNAHIAADDIVKAKSLDEITMDTNKADSSLQQAVTADMVLLPIHMYIYMYTYIYMCIHIFIYTLI